MHSKEDIERMIAYAKEEGMNVETTAFVTGLPVEQF